MKPLIAINRFFGRPYRWAVIFTAWLTLSFTYILLDTFVIARPEILVTPSSIAGDEKTNTDIYVSEQEDRTPSSTAQPEEPEQSEEVSTPEELAVEEPVEPEPDKISPAEPVITESSYGDENIRISIETIRKYDTDIYVADIQLSDAAFLRTAFARDTFGRNIKDTTSTIANQKSALLAINGDNYGSREAGFVLRNGTLYRDFARTPTDDDALLIDSGGNFQIIQETEVTAGAISDAWQMLTFGPALVENGELVVDGSSEVTYSPHSMTANPRTAIGQIGSLHYVFIVADGRTNESRGLTLLELAELFAELGCDMAYNLDGGGSSTMIFMDNVVNQPTTNGRSSGERKINDVVYIGYE